MFDRMLKMFERDTYQHEEARRSKALVWVYGVGAERNQTATSK